MIWPSWTKAINKLICSRLIKISMIKCHVFLKHVKSTYFFINAVKKTLLLTYYETYVNFFRLVCIN
jgi:hypothetical protein